MGTYSCDKFVTKPYISSSNYLLKMSNYEKKDYWVEEWKIIFWNFIKKNIDKLKKIPRLSLLINKL
jgi:deoxyribodipyrimidine photolyase-related protein